MSSVEIIEASDNGSREEMSNPTRLEKFVKLGIKVDCKFLVGSDEESPVVVEGHKFMFAEESPVFESMLYGNFKEAENSLEIPMPSDDPIDFKNLRLMLYSSDRTLELKYLSLSLDDAINLYRICDRYLITTLTEVCASYIETLLEKASPSDLIMILSFAAEFQIFGILNKTWNRLFALGYPLPSNLTALNPTQFVEYVSRASTHPNMTHFHLFQAIDAYLDHHKLIPKNLLDSGKPNNGEEGKKHELLKSLFICIDINKLKPYEVHIKGVISYKEFFEYRCNAK